MSRSVGEHNSRDMAGDGQLSAFTCQRARVWNFTDDIAAQSNCTKLNRANKRWERQLIRVNCADNILHNYGYFHERGDNVKNTSRR